mmetsp:Transcript_137169/g.426243  ORF Transcript_137169/g.426243 Transcript_137169/m.426243 type:complete len:112 (-) Transcript_137169:2-337(-)
MEGEVQRFWGDSAFNVPKKVCIGAVQPVVCTETLPQAFCRVIVTPVSLLVCVTVYADAAKHDKMKAVRWIVPQGGDRSLTGTPLMKRTMQIWNRAFGRGVNIARLVPRNRI